MLNITNSKDLSDLIRLNGKRVNIPTMAMRIREEEYHLYETIDNQLLDIIQIKSQDLEHMTEDEKLFAIYNWQKFYMLHQEEIKIIILNYPCELETNLNFLYKKLDKAKNSMIKKGLIAQIRELEYLADNSFELEFFIMIFAENIVDYTDKIGTYQGTLFQIGYANLISNDKKERLFYKLFNMNTSAKL